jgi:hypothetical protein
MAKGFLMTGRCVTLQGIEECLLFSRQEVERTKKFKGGQTMI